MGISSSMRVVTPSWAEQILKKNGPTDRNRKLNVSYVDKLAGEIKAGAWRETGSPIIVSRTGRLLDGQHRLYAVVKAQKPIRNLVVTGIEDKNFDAIDSGRPRHAADVLHIKGYNNVFSAASMLGLMDRYDSKKLNERMTSKHLNTRVMQLTNKYEGFDKHLIGTRTGMGMPVIPSAVSALVYILHREKADPAKIQVFIDQVVRGIGLEADSPTYKLREYTAQQRANSTVRRADDHLILLMHIWNMFMARKKVKRISWQNLMEDPYPKLLV